MLDQAVIILILISFIDLLFGLFVLYKDPKARVNRSFFLMALAALVWINASYFEDEFRNPEVMNIFLKADFSSGAFLAFFILLFCLDIAKTKISNNAYFRFTLYAIPVLLTSAVVLTKFIISGYEITQIGTINPTFGEGELIYDVLVFLALLIGVIVVAKNFRKASPEDKSQFIYLFIGLFLFVVIVSLTNIILTSYIENSLNYGLYTRLGIFSIVFVVVFSGYSIVKHRLLNLKIITTELLSLGILVFSLFQILSAQTLSDLLVNIILFIIYFIFTILLVRSVENEVKRKEELQKISDALAIANERLKELDMTKSEFISIASHQLRTPLTAIKGYISLLLEGSYGVVPAPIQDVLDKVYSVNNRLVHLVEDLLNVSRIEAGRIQYSFAPTQLEPLIAELVDMFSPTAKGKKLSLTMRLPEKPLPQLTLDPNKIKEVLSNLIDNALKYTKEGGVAVSLEGTSKVARIVVSDTGIGIHPEDKKNLFEKFLRSKETTKMVVSGAGLGLYVGKSFIEAHGGKIWAESDGPNKGSRFIIELPLVNPNIHVGTSDQPSQKTA